MNTGDDTIVCKLDRNTWYYNCEQTNNWQVKLEKKFQKDIENIDMIKHLQVKLLNRVY